MPPYLKILALFYLVMAGLPVEACPKESPEPPCQEKAQMGSKVKVLSISPNTAEPLRIGNTAKISVNVSYTLTSDAGTLTLVVQTANTTPITQNFEVITKGEGETILEAEFVVPSTKAIQVFVPLSEEGQHATSIVDSRAYKVVPAQQ